jgi:hypothetical protein
MGRTKVSALSTSVISEIGATSKRAATRGKIFLPKAL